MDTREAVDAFYWRQGPCCAGCDWWRYSNALVGQCHRSPPVAGPSRIGMLGFVGCSSAIPAGQPFTPRDHYCGEFADTFDRASLPIAYRKQVGALPPSPDR